MLFSVRTGVEVVITVVGCGQRLQPKRGERDVARAGTVSRIIAPVQVSPLASFRYRHITSDLAAPATALRTVKLMVTVSLICDGSGVSAVISVVVLFFAELNVQQKTV